ncbi:MAG TPA: 2-dehydropantoate 2-reductase N-terminal domain-containing protein [Acidimicrobiia bacterium]|jgi:2-dehydropantoate 2-reductase
MRFVVFGAGAIGGVTGARLHQGGHDVVLIARGAHRDAIAANGLTLRTPAESVMLDIPVAGDPQDIVWRGDDVVLLATKSQDTSGAIDALRSALPNHHVPIVCLQNGVANERNVLRYFENVYAVPVMCPTSHLEPGIVQASSVPVTGIYDIGRYPTGTDATCEEVAAAFGASTFVSEVRADVMRWKWSKLIMNLGNSVQAMCAPSDAASELVARARREATGILRAAGIDFASSAEDAERRGDILKPGTIDGQPRSGGSSWQSLARRSGSIETDYLNGEIVLVARLHGGSAPVNALLQRAAKAAAERHAAPGSVDAAPLLAQLR